MRTNTDAVLASTVSWERDSVRCIAAQAAMETKQQRQKQRRQKQSPGCDAGRGFVWLASASRLSRRAPLPAVGVVPGDELALERLLLTGQRHADVLAMQLLELRAARIIRHGRCRCD